jgi:uncharacterized protein
MKCPLCQLDLLMEERQGLEINCCPNCRGIWFDRETLEQILERTKGFSFSSPAPGHHEHKIEDHPAYHHGHAPKQKHKSFFEELFG